MSDAVEDFAPFSPEAEITRTGRWIHQIRIIDGLTATSFPWYAFGRAHAEKRARRKLAWYRRKYEPVPPEHRWTLPS